jgi:hypothetical protein
MFDVNSFLNTQTTDEFTKRPPLPPGDYIAVIGAFDEKSFRSGMRKDGSGEWRALNVRLDIDLTSSPEALMALGGEMTKVVVFDMVMFDLTPAGKLDASPGKNGRLAAYRNATGQNIKGQAWGIQQLTGQVVKVKIDHRDYNGELQESVKGVAAV